MEVGAQHCYPQKTLMINQDWTHIIDWSVLDPCVCVCVCVFVCVCLFIL